ncbi:MAG: hypothetical protein ACRDMV_22080 [Streptosporangiales bacterium]
MVVLGIIIAVIAVAFAIGVLLGNSTTIPLEFYGITIGGSTGVTIYIAGAVTLFVLLLGLWLIKRGTQRAVRKRREVKALRNRAHSSTAERPAVTDDTGGGTAETSESSASGKHAKGGPDADSSPDDPMQPPLR